MSMFEYSEAELKKDGKTNKKTSPITSKVSKFFLDKFFTSKFKKGIISNRKI